MKIAFIYSLFLKAGGVENIILWTSEEMKARGHDVLILTRHIHDVMKAELMRRRIPFRELHCPIPLKRSASFYFMARSIDPYLQGYDILNAHNFEASIWAFEATKGKHRPLYVATYHEPPRLLYERQMNAHFLASPLNRHRKPLTVWFDALALSGLRRWERRALRGARMVFTNSEYTAGKIQEIYGLNSVVCRFGVRHRVRETSSSTVEDHDGKEYIFTASRLTDMKNEITLIKAFKMVLDHFGNSRDIALHIAGDGDELPRLKSLTLELGVDRKVHFLGFLEEEELARQYASCSLVATLPLDEPYGLVLVEAGFYGKPVVASNHGGPACTVIDGLTGFLVDPLSPEGAAQAMMRILNDRALADNMGREARTIIRKNHSFERYIENFESTLLSIL